MEADSPSEVEFPVEAAPGHVRGGDVLERVVRYHVDNGTYHRFPAKDIHVTALQNIPTTTHNRTTVQTPQTYISPQPTERIFTSENVIKSRYPLFEHKSAL